MTRRQLTTAAAQVVVLAVVAWFVVAALRTEAGRFGRLEFPLQLNVAWLAASAATVLVAFAALIAAWQAVLRGWGQSLSYGEAARIWCLSNLGRYLPGKLWSVAGMAVLAQRSGVSGTAAIGSAVLLQLLALSTGIGLTIGLVPAEQIGSLLPRWVLWTGAGIAPVAALVLAGSPALMARGVRAAGRQPLELRPLPARSGLMGIATTALAWVLYGVALVFAARGLVAPETFPVGTAIGAFAGAYIVGLLAIVVPGGLGVREGLLVAMLAPTVGSGAAVVVAVGSRLVMTVAEIAAAGLALLGGGRTAITHRTD